MILPCPSCKAELSAALIGADGRCPYCGTKAHEPSPDPPSRPAAKPVPPYEFEIDTVPSPRARSAAPPSPPVAVDPPPATPTPVREAALPRGWGGLAVGARGILGGKPASVPARLLFRVEHPRTITGWDAWMVRFSDGGDGWLLDREGALAIVRPYKLPQPIAFESLREGQLVRFEGSSPATVVDIGTAVLRGAEGNTDLQRGARVRYATLAGDVWRYHLQWAEGLPFEALRGEVVDPSMLAAGFALRAPSGFKGSVSSSFGWFTQMPLAFQIALILLAIPAFAAFGIVVAFEVLAGLFR